MHGSMEAWKQGSWEAWIFNLVGLIPRPLGRFVLQLTG